MERIRICVFDELVGGAHVVVVFEKNLDPMLCMPEPSSLMAWYLCVGKKSHATLNVVRAGIGFSGFLFLHCVALSRSRVGPMSRQVVVVDLLDWFQDGKDASLVVCTCMTSRCVGGLS
jgi:hypothetical protein